MSSEENEELSDTWALNYQEGKCMVVGLEALESHKKGKDRESENLSKAQASLPFLPGKQILHKSENQ